jgi:transcription elongation factor Elf1
MGRRRKKYKRPVRRVHRIPTFFQCPNCGAKTLRIQFKTKFNTSLEKS